MSVYIIADITIKDRDAYTEYQRLVPSIIEKFGGRYLVSGGEVISEVGEWGLSRIVMLKFPSAADAQAFSTSDEYAPVAEIRHKAADTRSFMVEGIEIGNDGPAY